MLIGYGRAGLVGNGAGHTHHQLLNGAEATVNAGGSSITSVVDAPLGELLFAAGAATGPLRAHVI